MPTLGREPIRKPTRKAGSQVLCGRCLPEDIEEQHDLLAYHKHPQETCECCGRLDDVPTACCPSL